MTVEGQEVSRIGLGYLALLGVTHDDGEAEAQKIVRKICDLRIFSDEEGKINRSLEDVGGSVLIVSQFTLYADTSHGRRPSLSLAALPEKAKPLYERVVSLLEEKLGVARVGKGVFGAHMEVRLLNDGPFSVEIVVENKK